MLTLERVKTLNIGKNTTLMLLGDVFGVELTVVDKKQQKSVRATIPRHQVVEVMQYFKQVLEDVEVEIPKKGAGGFTGKEVQEELFQPKPTKILPHSCLPCRHYKSSLNNPPCNTCRNHNKFEEKEEQISELGG